MKKYIREIIIGVIATIITSGAFSFKMDAVHKTNQESMGSLIVSLSLGCRE